jgi:hypothetical protein
VHVATCVLSKSVDDAKSRKRLSLRHEVNVINEVLLAFQVNDSFFESVCVGREVAQFVAFLQQLFIVRQV